MNIKDNFKKTLKSAIEGPNKMMYQKLLKNLI